MSNTAAPGPSAPAPSAPAAAPEASSGPQLDAYGNPVSQFRKDNPRESYAKTPRWEARYDDDAPPAPPAPVAVEEPEGDGEIDDAQLLKEAIAIANGNNKDEPSAPSPTTGAQETAPASESPAKTEEKGPTAADWAKFYQQQKQLEAQKAEIEKAQEPYKQFQKARESGDIAEQLKLLGYEDGRQFLEMVAQHGSKMSPEALKMTQLERELKALQQERENERKQIEAQQARVRQQQAQERVVNDIRSQLKAIPDSLLHVNEEGVREVYRKMQQHYQKTKAETGRGVELTPKQAAEMVAKEWDAGLREFSKVPKFKKLMQQLLNEREAPRSAAPQRSVPRPAPQPMEQGEQRDISSILRGDKELEEAMRIIGAREKARRPD